MQANLVVDYHNVAGWLDYNRGYGVRRHYIFVA